MYTQAYREYIQTDRQTYRQTDRQTERHTETATQAGRLAGIHTDRQLYRHTNRQADNNTYRQLGIHPNIQGHIIADRDRDITTGHAVGQKDRQTYIPAYIT